MKCSKRLCPLQRKTSDDCDIKDCPYRTETEIMQLDYDLESVDYDYNDIVQTEMIHMICREEVLQIIDKQ